MIDAGSGLDVVWGSAGNDTIRGGSGNDSLFGDGGSDWVYGDAHCDYISGGADADSLFGGSGDDTIWTGMQVGDYAQGDSGRDSIDGSSSGDVHSPETCSSAQGFMAGEFECGSDGSDLELEGIELSQLDHDALGMISVAFESFQLFVDDSPQVLESLAARFNAGAATDAVVFLLLLDQDDAAIESSLTDALIPKSLAVRIVTMLGAVRNQRDQLIGSLGIESPAFERLLDQVFARIA